jgi:hypothetical protein
MHRILLFALLATPALAQTATDAEEAQKAGLSDAAIAKLTPEQLHDVLRHRFKEEPPAVAMVAVVGFFLASTLSVLGVLFAVYRIYRQRSETLRAMVEKGVPIPPELIAPKPRPGADIRRGLVLSGLGLGLGAFLFAVADTHGLWTVGLVPLLMGVGYLVAARLTKNLEATAG